jgi:hypothetical protein
MRMFIHLSTNGRTTSRNLELASEQKGKCIGDIKQIAYSNGRAET